MPIKAKILKDYLLTEMTLDLPSDVAELNTFMRSIKATAKVTILYQDGGIMGISIEQKKKTTTGESAKVRNLLNIETAEL